MGSHLSILLLRVASLCQSPATHHIAALTICPPLHSIEVLAPELGPTGSAHKATNMEDTVQGHNPSSIANHIFTTATTPT